MASTYLTRTPSSAGNQKLMTFSFWLKRGSLSPTAYGLFNRYISSGNYFAILLNDSDALEVRNYSGGGVDLRRSTLALFRDTSAWYHFVITIDTAQAVTDDRVKIYVNGVQQTLTGTNPSQNFDVDWNGAGANQIGTGVTSTYFNGSMAHVHFIDGTAYAASDFGQTNTLTGIWSPKTAPSVTYGTNGFFLKFENSGSMGTDSSGNGNNFSVGGGTLTQTLDTPSNVFATWNPLDRKATGTPSFANGNLYFSHSANSQINTRSTLAFSKGKYYAEFKITSGDSYTAFGIAEYDTTNVVIADSADGALLGGSGYLSGGAIANGDIIGIAIDADAQTCKWYINNALEATYDYSAKTGLKDSTSLCFGVFSTTSGGTNYTQANFGNGYFGTSAISSPSSDENGLGLFQYQPPTGYLSLCTKNINAQEYA